MNLRENKITLGELMQNPNAKTILEQELPRYMNHPMLKFAYSMPLSGIINFSAGKVPPSKVNSILKQLEKA